MLKRWLFYAVAAAGLAAVSPGIASSIHMVDLEAPGLLGWWFVLAPLQLEMLLQPGPQHRAWVWMAVYFTEQLALVGALSWIVLRLRARRAPPDPATLSRAFDTAVSRYHLQD